MRPLDCTEINCGITEASLAYETWKQAVAEDVPVGEKAMLPTAVVIVIPDCSPEAPICLSVC